MIVDLLASFPNVATLGLDAIDQDEFDWLNPNHVTKVGPIRVKLRT